MRLTERDERPLPLADAPKAAILYCLSAMVVDEASEAGFAEFARAIEGAMGRLLSTLPAEQQATALRLSYELAVSGFRQDEAAPPPRLRLVYSR